jgi:predicted RNA-binding protein (TIGR00451 family)
MNKDLALQKIRSVANYQFATNVGEDLFPDDVSISFSKRTGKIRYIHLYGGLLATLRARDGLLALTIEGAKRLLRSVEKPRFRVIVRDDVARFIAGGRNVFAKHVIDADPEVRPGEEVVVTNSKDEVLAVGRSLLTGEEMLVFKRGVAVRVRRGAER